jgi:hypothetical protein
VVAVFGEDGDTPDQRGGQLAVAQWRVVGLAGGVQLVGGVEDLVRRPSCAGGVRDGGDQGRPGRVGEDPGCRSLAEELREDGGPVGSQRLCARVVSAGDGGGGEVRGQAPPQRGRRLFVGSGRRVRRGGGEGGDVDAGAFRPS